MSPSSRRAWIEIKCSQSRRDGTKVALLAEGVDRNDSSWSWRMLPCVALLAEGVDRNYLLFVFMITVMLSPSSRRAWIEISIAL